MSRSGAKSRARTVRIGTVLVPLWYHICARTVCTVSTLIPVLYSGTALVPHWYHLWSGLLRALFAYGLCESACLVIMRAARQHLEVLLLLCRSFQKAAHVKERVNARGVIRFPPQVSVLSVSPDSPLGDRESDRHTSSSKLVHTCSAAPVPHGCCKCTALLRHLYNLGSVLVLRWYYAGAALVLYLYLIGTALAVRRFCSGATCPEQYCVGTSTALVVHSYTLRRDYIVTVLVLNECGIGTAPILCQSCTGAVVVLHGARYIASGAPMSCSYIVGAVPAKCRGTTTAAVMQCLYSPSSAPRAPCSER